MVVNPEIVVARVVAQYIGTPLHTEPAEGQGLAVDLQIAVDRELEADLEIAGDLGEIYNTTFQLKIKTKVLLQLILNLIYRVSIKSRDVCYFDEKAILVKISVLFYPPHDLK